MPPAMNRAAPTGERDQHSARARMEMRDGREEWFRIQAAVKDEESETTSASVYIYDSIGGWWGVSAKSFMRDLVALDVDELQVHINSPGGDVYDGIAILNTLRGHRARVVVTVDGIAASAASFIAMAADELVMGRNSELMVHDAWSFTYGNAEDLRKDAERLDAISNNIASIYAERAGGSTEDWRAVMVAETWYSAQEAVDAGLADRVAEKGEAAERTDQTVAPEDDEESWDDTWDRSTLEVFAHAGRRAAPAPPLPAARARAPRSPVAPAPGVTATERSTAVAFSDEQLTTMRNKLGLPADATEATIVDALTEALDEQATEPADSPTLPDGVVSIDSATLASLKAAAERGDQAAKRQEREDREALVSNAIQDGRIAPARKDHWLASLAADPGAADTLAKLEKGLVPVDERGYASDPGDEVAPSLASITESDLFKKWTI